MSEDGHTPYVCCHGEFSEREDCAMCNKSDALSDPDAEARERMPNCPENLAQTIYSNGLEAQLAALRAELNSLSSRFQVEVNACEQALKAERDLVAELEAMRRERDRYKAALEKAADDLDEMDAMTARGEVVLLPVYRTLAAEYRAALAPGRDGGAHGG